MTSSSPNRHRAGRASRGFTLTEVIIAATLGTIVLAGVLSTFVMLVRSGTRVENYSMMETQTRRAFERLGIDARMANAFSAHFTSGQVDAFTLTIPTQDLTSVYQVTYGYDTSDPTNKKFYYTSPQTGRLDLITNVTSLTILRYYQDGTLIQPSVTDSTGIKHLQISVSVTRSGVGLADATQVIRSSAFTIRNM